MVFGVETRCAVCDRLTQSCVLPAYCSQRCRAMAQVIRDQSQRWQKDLDDLLEKQKEASHETPPPA